MTDSEYLKIYEGNFIIINMVRSRLEAAGISPIIKDESESGRLAGFGSSIQGFQQVYVNANQFNKATIIVEQIKAEFES